MGNIPAPSMPRDEARRREYLRNLGIDIYLPRFVLPGAKPSAVSAGTATAGKPAAAAPISARTESPTATPAVSAAVETAKTAEAAVPKTAPPKPAGQAEVRFQLVFIHVSDSICALNQLPYTGGGKSLGGERQRLFANLCRALKLDTGALSFDSVPFRWPLAESDHIDKSERAARSALQAYLSQKLSGRGCKRLLVMGSGLVPILSDDGEAEDGPLPLDGYGCEAVYCRSLDEMLNLPKLKREVWERLRARIWHDFP